MSPVLYPLLVALIGLAVGIGAKRLRTGWLSRLKVAGTSNATIGLVGIAGAFLGYHAGIALGLTVGGPLPLLGALVGAALVVWLWQGR